MADKTFTFNIKALFDASDVKNKVGDIQNALKNIKLPDTLRKNLDSSFSDLSKALANFESKAAKGVKSQTDVKGITSSMDTVVKEFTKVSSIIDKVKAEVGDTVDLSKIIKLDDKTTANLKSLEQQINVLKTEISDINVSKLSQLQTTLKQIKSEKASAQAGEAVKLFETGDIQGALDLLDQVIAKQERLESSAANRTGTITANLNNLRDLRTQIADAAQQVEEKTQKIGQLSSQQANVAKQAFSGIVNGINGASSALEEYKTQAEKAEPEVKKLAENQAQFNKEVDQVKSRIQYFFGLQNAINLVKRAIRGAFDTIKELDKAMTETAVVTDFTVSDMWKQLPEYTKRANELGVTTLAAYEAATLYYQQGLKTNEVNALSVETLKMARIAGLDAAEATDRMTNALRGFNMELTTANAQRVDDVYSELAANTASNVDEISTAMTKVASLAHNANMEFETTAAFLSQIIETTRESAETAGTALKTVVARFSEVKKLVDEGTLRGQDEEGQVIDVNRVGAALRTAGIDLNKYFLGEVGLDDIFMELASKWDSLTSVQQRYIATQAAGSRQQSRFIALMQDYARTQELVGKAYNANGASARQFAKTQESLESKLNRLKNAWNEFLMGLTNNVVVKTFVDALTTLLNGFNKLTGAIETSVGSLGKWAVSWGAVIAAISEGKILFKSGGLIEGALSALTGGTIFGTALSKVGIGNAAASTTQRKGLFGNISNRIQQLRQDTITQQQLQAKLNPNYLNAKRQYQTSPSLENLRAVAQARQAALNEEKKLNPTSLMGMLGTKYKSTGAGKLASKALAKMGVAGGNAAAVSGTAALAASLGAVAVAVGVVVAGYQAWLRLTPEGQLKQAKQLAEVMNKTASETSKAAAEMKKARDSYKEYNEAVKGATTLESRQEAIDNRNEYITSLLEQNESLAKYVTTTQENGQFVLTINEAELEAAVNKVSEGAIQAAIGADFANALQAGKQADILENRIRQAGVNLEQRTITSYDSAGVESTRKLTDAEYTKYAQYAQAAADARAEQRSYAQQAYGQTLQDVGLKDDVANLLSSALAESFNEDEYLKQVNQNRSDNWWSGNATKKELQAEYYRLFGTQADANLKRGELARIVAQEQANQEQQKNADKAAEYLTGGNKEFYQNLLDAYSGSGVLASMSLEELDIFSGLSEEDIAKELGFDKLKPEQLEAFAKTLNTDTKGLYNHIKAAAADTKQLRQQTQENLYQKMFEAGIGLDKGTQGKVQQMSPEQQQAALEAITNGEGLLSTKLFQQFASELTSLSTDELKQYSDFFNSIDLDDPIEALKTLNAIGEASPFAEYAQDIRETNKELFSTSGLVQSFIASADYESLTEQLADFIKENGRITGKNIEDLAEDCDKLNDLLDLAEVNTYGLAKAFTLVETGALDFSNLTDSILKALSATMSLSDAVDELSGFISDFDPGRDFGEGADFFHEQAESLQELVEGYEFGNERTQTIYDALFGEGAYKKFMETNWEKGPEKVAELIAQKISDRDYLMRDNSYGFMDTRSKEAGGAYGKITRIGDYDFQWDIGDRTTEQLIEDIQRDFELRGQSISREAAESIITGWASQSWDFADQLNTNNFNAAIQEWANNLSNTSIISQEQLEAFGKAFNMTADEVKEALKEVKGEANIPVYVKWTDDKGEPLTGAALKDEWDKLVEESNIDKSNFITTERLMAGATISRIDVDKLFEVGKTAGLSDDRIAEIANEYVNDLQNAILTKEITVPIYTKVDDGNGNETIEVSSKNITIESSTFEGLTAAENAAMEAAQYDMVGKIISEQNVDGLGDNIYKAAVAGATSAGPEIKEIIEQYLAANPITANIQGKVTNIDEGPRAATGGFVRSLAAGSSSHWLQPGFALTGEEGPEIVWNKEKGYSYITGQDGPEYRDLQPGDRVFNAQETSRILKNSSFAKGGVFGSYSTGGYNPNKLTDNDKGGGGSGSAADKNKEEKWKNEVDWLYNLVEDIAELERIQTKLQEEYEDYLQDEAKTGQDLYKLLIQQLGNLYTQLDHQTFALEKREQEMREFMDTTNQYDDYLWYNWNDRTLEIDWDRIEALKDNQKDTYDEIVDLISEAEDIQGKMDDAEDAVMDIQNQIQELENIWRDTFTDFEDRVYTAIVKRLQEVIDNYSELNETLNSSNQAILQSIQKEISLQRQIRDNTKTEEEIANDEAQLAFLRRDTSGANDLAAMELEKQLADNRENYENTLIDQAIARLQDDNDAAAQQREHQIEIMQAQLDYQEQSGEFNAMVLELLQSAMGADGELLTNSDLVDLLKDQENWGAMSDVSKQVWEEELNTTFKEVAAFLLKQNAEQNGTFITALTGAIGAVNSSIGSYSQGMMKFLNESSSRNSSGGSGGSPSNYTGGGNTTTSEEELKDIDPRKRRTGGCFAKGTKILMANNIIKNIEDIKINELVIAYDEEKNIFVLKKVTKSYIHHNTPSMVRITFTNNDILELTPGHPLYSTNGWKSLDIENSLYEHGTIATLLHVGDEIIGINENKIVQSIEYLNIGMNYDSYNIEVEDCHTFLANGLVAHNMKIMGAYATGGLASATGPAWLDGTPSEPEYVLNARQTDAFLRLADVLPAMFGNSTNSNVSNASNITLNLAMNVDKISSDYDVDRIADRVKEIVYNAGSYRNVNTLSFVR